MGGMIIFLASALAHIEWEPKWQTCVSDRECVVVYGSCAPNAVNVRYKHQAQEWSKVANQNKKCRHYDLTMFSAHCINNSCQVQDNSQGGVGGGQ